MATEAVSNRNPTGSPSVIVTHHAQQRMDQRNLNCKDVEYIIGNGRHSNQAGVVHIHLRRKDIPSEDRADSSLARLEGVTVVMSSDELVVVTVWRNRERGSSHIRHKPRFGH